MTRTFVLQYPEGLLPSIDYTSMCRPMFLGLVWSGNFGKQQTFLSICSKTSFVDRHFEDFRIRDQQNKSHVFKVLLVACL